MAKFKMSAAGKRRHAKGTASAKQYGWDLPTPEESESAAAFDAMEAQAAFKRASVFVVLRNGAVVGTVAIAHPADGAGVLRAFVREDNAERGWRTLQGSAGGYGYDKRSAAVQDAAARFGGSIFGVDISKIGGLGWDSALIRAGLTVFRAL